MFYNDYNWLKYWHLFFGHLSDGLLYVVYKESEVAIHAIIINSSW